MHIAPSELLDWTELVFLIPQLDMTQISLDIHSLVILTFLLFD